MGGSTYVFGSFQDSSRYWRLYFRENQGGSHFDIRNVRFYGPEDSLIDVQFNIIPDGEFHIYYVPINEKMRGILTQIRLYPALQVDPVAGKHLGSKAPKVIAKPTCFTHL